MVALAVYDDDDFADMSSSMRDSFHSHSLHSVMTKSSSCRKINDSQSQKHYHLRHMMSRQSNEHKIDNISVNSGHSISSIASATSVVRGCVLTNSKEQDVVVSTHVEGSAVGDNSSKGSVSASMKHPIQVFASIDESLAAFHHDKFDEDTRSAASELLTEGTSISHSTTQLQASGNSHTARIIRQQSTFFHDSEGGPLQSQDGELSSLVSNAYSDAEEPSQNMAGTVGVTSNCPMRPALLRNWGRKLTLDVSSGNRRARNVGILKEKYDFPNGLAKQMCRCLLDFPLRIWLIDNSDSMNTMDGLCFVHGKSRAKQMVPCSRWKELLETVRYHAELAMDLGAPTLFRFITDPALANPKIPKDKKQLMGICISEVEKKDKEREWVMTGLKDDDDFQWEDFAHSDFQAFSELLDQVVPRYTTPLAENVRAIKKQIERIHTSLIDNCQRVCVTIATDGIPEDRSEFQDAIVELYELPVWVVIRLCTSHDDVLHFWTSFDLDLEFDLDVIDDFKSEADEVMSCNPWLTYVEPVHRAREWGFSHRIFDLLDEIPFSASQMAEYCATIFGVSVHDLKPEGDKAWWLNFYDDIVSLLLREKKYYDPLSSSCKKLINMQKLGEIYGGKFERRRQRKKIAAKSGSKNKHLSALQEEDELIFDDAGVDMRNVNMNTSDIPSTNHKGCCILS